MQNEMRKILKKSLAAALAAAMLLGVTYVAPVQAAPKAKKIYLNAKSKTLKVGGKFTLKVKKVKPAKAKTAVTWKTNKKSVAKVNKKGVVTALKVGNAKITATSKSNKKVKATCNIKVNPKTDVVVPTPTAAPTSAPTTAPTTAPTAEPTVNPTNTPKPTPTPFVLPEESLKDNADFLVGTVVGNNPNKKNYYLGKEFTQLAAQQFDVVSFENEMKGYSLIDVSGSAKEAEEKNDDTVVKCNFDTADAMVKWAETNGLKVRGHVLFWEQSMPKAFFYQKYVEPSTEEEETANLVTEETLKKRMQNYADQVIDHFKDKVIAWDVVNEAIDIDGAADKETGLHLYTDGNFYKILGADYIKYAFQYAKEARRKAGKTSDDIQLFYNDFNCFQDSKPDYIVSLIRYLNKDEKLLDCMGMEGYVLTYWPGEDLVKKAMDKFVKEDVKVGINELCIRMNPTIANDHNKADAEPEKAVTEQNIKDHAERCEKLFQVYCDFYKSNPGKLTNVSIWALTDRPDLIPEANKTEGKDYDYEIYGTHSGLFTEVFDVKESFNKVINVLKKNKSDK